MLVMLQKTAALAAILFCCVDLAPGQESLKGWGRIVDPHKDCEFKLAGDKLSLRLPGGVHDLNPRTGKVDAPRVLQDVDGDFSILVKVAGEMKPGIASASKTSFSFNGAGILVWQDDKNLIRLERNTWVTAKGDTVCLPPLFEYFKDGKYMNTNPAPTSKPFFGPSTHLRLDRRGDKVRAFLSHDGRDWSIVKEITVDLARKLRVGVAGVSTSQQPFVAEFEGLRVLSQ
jgi:regulation of enolase protein 1 (concanavalin A-like superfamily)